jgi:hypothetical protein
MNSHFLIFKAPTERAADRFLRRMISATFAAFSATLIAFGPIDSRADQIYTFTGSGYVSETKNTDSAKATFDVAASGLLTITLQNTTAGGSLNHGDLLNSIVFNLANPKPTKIALNSISLGAGSQQIEVSGSGNNITVTTSNTKPGQSTWTTQFNGLTQNNIAYGFGLSDVGQGSTFQNPSGGGGGKNGIAAAGTNFAQSDFKQASPFYSDTLVFQIQLSGVGSSLPTVTDAGFIFGTSGASGGFVPAVSVPEPTSLALAAIGMGCAGGVRALRRKKILA